ncbi:MAG: LysR family transcriptional regulator [Bauldia sp.]|jgi:molybdate transport system regulatory protein|nr:LysR family transcriptional regulator [Bauldia sp.]
MAQRFRSSLRLGLGDEIAMGPGKAQLLELIRDTGSIASAGRRMRMSYKRAWSLVVTMNRCFREPLVAVSRGGADGGGASLTDLGVRILADYQRLAALVEASPELARLRGAAADDTAG